MTLVEAIAGWRYDRTLADMGATGTAVGGVMTGTGTGAGVGTGGDATLADGTLGGRGRGVEVNNGGGAPLDSLLALRLKGGSERGVPFSFFFPFVPEDTACC